MSEAAADRLRSLVKDYQQGRLSFPEYRRLRTSLLDSLGREPGVEVVAAELIAEVITQPRPPAPSLVRSGDGITRKSTAPSRSRWLGALVLGLVVTTIGVLLMLNRSGRERSGVPDQGVPISSDRIYEVIEPLMQNPDWGEARIAAVNASLLEEGARQIAARQQTAWFQRFAVEVRRRLASQRAAGTAGLVPDQSSLAALAVTIGINLNDLDAPLMPPPRGGTGSTARLPDHR
jgi:hypothetical protein